MQDISSLTKMNGLSTGIYEDKQPIYNLREQQEEDKLFKVNEAVRNLLKGLEESLDTPTGNKDEIKAQ